MTEEKKGGMSKGCVVGLIIVGVLAILVIALGVVCWVYKDDLARMGVNSVVTSMTAYVEANEIEGVDSEAFVALTTEFQTRFGVEEDLLTVKAEQVSVLMTVVQDLASKEEFTADEIDRFAKAMISFYPDLADMTPYRIETMSTEEAMMEGGEVIEDTVGAE